MAGDLPDGLETPDEIANYAADRYEAQAFRPPEGLTIPQCFHYLHFKAFGFLFLGLEAYRKVDAFGFPEPWMDGSHLQHGCEQILEWRGLSPERPLEGLGIRGFNRLLLMFHFRLRRQSAEAVEGEPNVFLDEMAMEHIVDGRDITLYNKVDHTKPPPADCPYCGAKLRTATARQCRSCGMDWHDPSNVICRKNTGTRGT